MKNFVDELKWRGMVHDMTPSTDTFLKKESTSGYIGFDPTADSLHIGNLVQIMTLVHFQNYGLNYTVAPEHEPLKYALKSPLIRRKCREKLIPAINIKKIIM